MADMANARRLAAELLVKHESIRLKAYPDPGSKDGLPWTIGYGHTEGVKQGDVCTRAQAKAWLVEDLGTAEAALTRKIGKVLPELTDHQAAALLSFVFNCGTGNPKKPEWTIWKVLRAKQYAQVPGKLIEFVNNDGVKMQGLVNRRTAEIRLWSTAEPGSVAANPPSFVTRTTPTPPTNSDPVPPAKSAKIITGVLGVATTVPVAGKAVIDAVSPWVQYSESVGRIIAAVALVAAAAAVITLAINWYQKHRDRH